MDEQLFFASLSGELRRQLSGPPLSQIWEFLEGWSSDRLQDPLADQLSEDWDG